VHYKSTLFDGVLHWLARAHRAAKIDELNPEFAANNSGVVPPGE